MLFLWFYLSLGGSNGVKSRPKENTFSHDESWVVMIGQQNAQIKVNRLKILVPIMFIENDINDDETLLKSFQILSIKMMYNVMIWWENDSKKCKSR